MILGFIGISTPSWFFFTPFIFQIIFYQLLKNLVPKVEAISEDDLLDFEGKKSDTNYRTYALGVAIFFILVFLFVVSRLSFLAGLIASFTILLFPILILGYGLYNVVMMIRYQEPRDYKYWIAYFVISFFTSFIVLLLFSVIGF